jgi:O-antigen/teichoic acid export membrane protein
MKDAGSHEEHNARWRISLEGIFSRIKDRLLLNAGYLLGVTLVGTATGFIFWALAARLYEAQQVGLAASVISIVQLLAGIASMGLGVGLVRFLPESDDPNKLLNVAFTLTTILSLLCGSVYLVGVGRWSPSLQVLLSRPNFAIGFLGFLVITGIGVLLPLAFLAHRKAKYALWQVLILNGVRLALVVALAKAGAFGIVTALVIGIAAADVASLLIFLPRLGRHYQVRPDLSIRLLRQLVPYSIGNYTSDLFYRAPILLASPLALERFGSEASAHAYVAWMIGSLLASPGVALAQSAIAEGSHTPSDLRRILLRAVRYALGVTIPLALVVGVGARWILGVFGASYADEAVPLLRWLALAAPLATIVILYFSALRIRKRLFELLVLSAMVGGITLLGPLLYAEKFNLSSMGIGWLAAQAGVVSVVAFQLLRSEFVQARRSAVAATSVSEQVDGS